MRWREGGREEAGENGRKEGVFKETEGGGERRWEEEENENG